MLQRLVTYIFIAILATNTCIASKRDSEGLPDPSQIKSQKVLEKEQRPFPLEFFLENGHHMALVLKHLAPNDVCTLARLKKCFNTKIITLKNAEPFWQGRIVSLKWQFKNHTSPLNPNISELSLWSIVDVDLLELLRTVQPRLRTLRLSQHGVRVSDNNDLERQLTDILLQCTNLKNLWLCGHILDKPALDYFLASACKLSSLSDFMLEGLPENILHCASLVQQLPDSLTALSLIKSGLTNDEVTDLLRSLDKRPKITILGLSDNIVSLSQIDYKSISLSGLRHIRDLSFSDNIILLTESVCCQLSGLGQLEQFSLGANRFGYKDVYYFATFSLPYLTNLVKLDLSHIQGRAPESVFDDNHRCQTLAPSFQGLQKLRHLNLARNNLACNGSPEHMNHLLDALGQLPQLSELDLSGNNLMHDSVSYPKLGLTNVRKLNLSENPLWHEGLINLIPHLYSRLHELNISATGSFYKGPAGFKGTNELLTLARDHLPYLQTITTSVLHFDDNATIEMPSYPFTITYKPTDAIFIKHPEDYMSDDVQDYEQFFW